MLAVLAGEQILECSPESTPRPVQPPTRGHREATEDSRDLCRGEALPLGQQKNLAIPRPEPAKRRVHERLLSVRRGRLLLSGHRFEGQPFLQRDAAAARTPLVRNHPPRRHVQPDACGVTLGQLIQTTPRRQEYLGHRVLRVALGGSPPTAVRDDVGAVRREQSIEALGSITLALPPMH